MISLILIEIVSNGWQIYKEICSFYLPITNTFLEDVLPDILSSVVTEDLKITGWRKVSSLISYTNRNNLGDSKIQNCFVLSKRLDCFTCNFKVTSLEWWSFKKMQIWKIGPCTFNMPLQKLDFQEVRDMHIVTENLRNSQLYVVWKNIDFFTQENTYIFFLFAKIHAQFLGNSISLLPCNHKRTKFLRI